jgi:hypothetical protein
MVNVEKDREQKFSLLRIMAIVLLFAGGIVSAWFTIDVLQDYNSVYIKSILLVWVLSPLLTILKAYSLSGRWSAIRRGILYNIMLLFAFISMIAYSGEWNLPGIKPAFTFLIIPAFCWTLMIIAYFIVKSRKAKG